METLTIVFGVISAITTILSVIFAILAFTRNKNQDNTALESRLTSIEKDILYIRNSLDENKEWKHDMEIRISKLEKKTIALETKEKENKGE